MFQLFLVLLKNWTDSATCSSSTYQTWEITVVLGAPPEEHVVTVLGNIPCKHGICSSVIIISMLG